MLGVFGQICSFTSLWLFRAFIPRFVYKLQQVQYIEETFREWLIVTLLVVVCWFGARQWHRRVFVVYSFWLENM